jgi:colanic acid/amylovoran biosynthesis protein
VDERAPIHHVITLGASLTANKGAAAMLTTVTQRLPEQVGRCTFSVLSTDPSGDTARCHELESAEILDLRPLRLALLEFPLALLAAVLRALRVPRRLVPLTRVARRISEADIAVDLAGISFVDSRGVPNLIYNTLMSSLPILHGTPTVKAAQAIGPCRKTLTRMAARLVLRRMRWVGARGAQTQVHLDELDLMNSDTVADLAFSLREDASLPAHVASTLPTGDFITVIPSIVVERLFNDDPSHYLSAMATLVEELMMTTGQPVVIAAHSYERSDTRHRMNDRPTLLELAERLSHLSDVTVIDEELTAGQLRHLISCSTFLVTSRFHAMISALATCTPVYVIGWSHKYREVLSEFGLEYLGAGHMDLADPSALASAVAAEVARREQITAAIARALPEVTARSEINFARMAEVMGVTR